MPVTAAKMIAVFMLMTCCYLVGSESEDVLGSEMRCCFRVWNDWRQLAGAGGYIPLPDGGLEVTMSCLLYLGTDITCVVLLKWNLHIRARNTVCRKGKHPASHGLGATPRMPATPLGFHGEATEMCSGLVMGGTEFELKGLTSGSTID